MTNISIADAKARLSELVERAEAGDEICITRRGKPVAKLTAAKTKRKPIDIEALRALTASGPRQKESAGKFIRRMRDEDRY
jgi:prevent-host-death family protein